jgi:hypothetical protein
MCGEKHHENRPHAISSHDHARTALHRWSCWLGLWSLFGTDKTRNRCEQWPCALLTRLHVATGGELRGTAWSRRSAYPGASAVDVSCIACWQHIARDDSSSGRLSQADLDKSSHARCATSGQDMFQLRFRR